MYGRYVQITISALTRWQLNKMLRQKQYCFPVGLFSIKIRQIATDHIIPTYMNIAIDLPYIVKGQHCLLYHIMHSASLCVCSKCTLQSTANVIKPRKQQYQMNMATLSSQHDNIKPTWQHSLYQIICLIVVKNGTWKNSN